MRPLPLAFQTGSPCCLKATKTLLWLNHFFNGWCHTGPVLRFSQWFGQIFLFKILSSLESPFWPWPLKRVLLGSPYLRNVIIHTAGNVVWWERPRPASACAVPAHWPCRDIFHRRLAFANNHRQKTSVSSSEEPWGSLSALFPRQQLRLWHFSMFDWKCCQMSCLNCEHSKSFCVVW